ncbi:hypothetical protein QKU58_gp069 [Pyramimonas orientalis virus]|uniref:Uncharacterized protein n=1 Tax=Pyramimonas orientalis virus 01B TaxID=3134525 RepID=A0A7M3UNJ9_9VIRU|nr:hypothetical protein QKU58_gp069 [Pyramimonas orientalis virus]QOI90262.1 hypothetical protein HWQ62_00125 [Pyramimonas orientalis virus]
MEILNVFKLIIMLVHVLVCALLVIVLIFIIVRLFKTNEQFVNDFDDVMDNKCLLKSNQQLDNYIFGQGVCKKNTCPAELCSRFRLNTRTNLYEFVTELSPQLDTSTDGGEFTCQTKESIPDKVYCQTPVPTCERQGESNFCYELVDADPTDSYSAKEWRKMEYIKKLDDAGNCIWENTMDPSNNDKDDGYFDNCQKQEINCSDCNIPCASLPREGVSFRDNYQKFILGNDGTCIEDTTNGCFECDESQTKIGYKLNSVRRQVEPVFFRQQVYFDGICVFLDENNNCHPDDIATYPEYCGTQTDIISGVVETGNCASNPYRFCCNLNNRDMFEQTKYRSLLSEDGRKCVYASVDASKSRELDISDPDGFNCPGYDFRLCTNPDEYRNVDQQRCTPCPPDKFLADNTQFFESQACVLLPDCSDQVDVCFEKFDGLGTILTKNEYEKVPQITRTPGQVLATASCVSSSPSDCVRTCMAEKTVVVPNHIAQTPDTFCDHCQDNKKFNPVTFSCDDEQSCPNKGTTQKCLDKHLNQFFDYTVSQLDDFSPCVLERYHNNIPYTMNLNECETDCPANYVEDTTTNKCIIPECVFNKSYRVTDNIGGVNDVIFDNTQNHDVAFVFDNIRLNEVKHHPTYCKINHITKNINVSARNVEGAPVCRVSDDTSLRVPEVSVQEGDLYNTETARAEQTVNGANGDCPVDCRLGEAIAKNTCFDENNRDKFTGDERRCYYRDEQDVHSMKGVTTRTRTVIQDKAHFGMDCQTAADNLEQGLDYQEGSQPKTFKRTTTCDLPQCDVHCVSAGHTTNCGECQPKQDDPCSFEKTCELTITQQPFGNGRICSEPLTKKIDCATREKQCDVCNLEWVYNDIARNTAVNNSVWDNIPSNSPTSDVINEYCGTNGPMTYSRSSVVTNDNHCTYQDETRAPGVVIKTESKTVGKCALTQGEIDYVCNDDNNFVWDRDFSTSCSCYINGSSFYRTGTLKNKNFTQRGMEITCANKGNTVSCDSHYTSQFCTDARSELQREIDDKAAAEKEAADKAEKEAADKVAADKAAADKAAAETAAKAFCADDNNFDWVAVDGDSCDCTTLYKSIKESTRDPPEGCSSKDRVVSCKSHYDSEDCVQERLNECKKESNYTPWSSNEICPTGCQNNGKIIRTRIFHRNIICGDTYLPTAYEIDCPDVPSNCPIPITEGYYKIVHPNNPDNFYLFRNDNGDVDFTTEESEATSVLVNFITNLTGMQYIRISYLHNIGERFYVDVKNDKFVFVNTDSRVELNQTQSPGFFTISKNGIELSFRNAVDNIFRFEPCDEHCEYKSIHRNRSTSNYYMMDYGDDSCPDTDHITNADTCKAAVNELVLDTKGTTPWVHERNEGHVPKNCSINTTGGIHFSSISEGSSPNAVPICKKPQLSDTEMLAIRTYVSTKIQDVAKIVSSMQLGLGG